MKKPLVFFLASVVLVLIVVFWFFNLSNSNENRSNQIQKENSPKALTENISQNMNNQKKYIKAEEVLKKDLSYKVVLNTTQGEIVVVLNESTPITSNNFAYLSKEGFYDGTIFHRAINGFMIQGGDPTGTGMGGPGYKFDDEKFDGDYKRGVVAMANSGPNTNGSQFFIMHKDYPLPKNYVIFGSVSEGIDVVDKIATADVEKSFSGELSKPVKPVSIITAKLVENLKN